MRRWVYLACGLVFTALGIVGAFLPLMPTTIFLILAAGCFARSSPRLEAWLLDHAQFIIPGPAEHGLVDAFDRLGLSSAPVVH